MQEKNFVPESEIKKLVETKVILEFIRHGEKEKASKPEDEILLTEKGRKMATERGKELSPQPEVAMAFGSPRKRAQETAGHVLMAESGLIGDNANLEEMEAAIKNELKVGKKIASDSRLDFQRDTSSPLGSQILTAYKAGRVMDYLVHESDEVARNTNDKEGLSYSRLAANVAEVVKKYLIIANNFERVANGNPEKYSQYHNQLERYLGTHQSVGESFVAKLIEDTEGVDARDEFIKQIGAGFGELHGFQVVIVDGEGKQSAVVHAKTKNKQWDIPVTMELLDKIISERF